MLPVPDPIAFTVFGLEVRWYGICIAIGMLVALLTAYKRAPRFEIPQSKVIDWAIVAIIFGIIGARVYYVVFSWDYYGQHLDQILNFRGGGLAIHGGIIFGILFAAIFGKIWGLCIRDGLDLFAPSIAIAQAIGRWGNYFNSEAHGGPTDLPWAIEVDGVMVHPTFLYESIWCVILFVFLLFMSNRRIFRGQIFLLYGILYSVERFFVEGLRTDSLMIGSLRQAQVLSLVVIVVFLILYIYSYLRWKKRAGMYY
ncbi:MAG: prolipoprotein diacylglyceryl transferase [Clostridiales bacterium]|nr:prolipoprotein diacylglyceryl transferase [Clostridiales bacterium]